MPRNATEAAAEPLNDDLRLMFQQIGQGMSALAQNVTALAQQNNTILQALGPDLANISQAVQNPAALSGIENSIRYQARPTLDPYNPQRPHHWAATTLDKIQIWDVNMYQFITMEARTIANPATVPGPPALTYDQPTDEVYISSRLMYLYLHAAVPLSVQQRIETDAEDRCTSRGDELLRFSAYYAWQKIVRHDKHMAASHLSRLRTLSCTRMEDLSMHLVQVRVVIADYLGSIPRDQRDIRDNDISQIIIPRMPPPVRDIIDTRMFDTPITRRASHDVMKIANTALTNFLANHPEAQVGVAGPRGIQSMPALPAVLSVHALAALGERMSMAEPTAICCESCASKARAAPQ